MEETGYGKRVVVQMEGQSPGGTILEMNAGKKTDMTFHIDTDKVVYLLSGEIMAWVVKDGQMASLSLKPGASFYVKRGLVHQFESVSPSILVEFTSDTHMYEQDQNIVSKGTALDPPVESSTLAKMTPEDEASLEQPEEKKKTTRKKKPATRKTRATKKTTKKTKRTTRKKRK